MRIEISDPALAERMQRQIESTGAASAEEALNRLLQTQEEQDRFLLDNRQAINARIRRGIEQLDRGEGSSGDEAWARLRQRRAVWLSRNHRSATNRNRTK